MGHNMMTTQKWYEHITNVIIGNTANFNSGCLDSIDYVDERKGVPLAELHPKSWTHPLQLTRCSFFMTKYTLHFKYQAVLHYLHIRSQQRTADHYGISRTHLRRWIRAYQEGGIGALEHPQSKTMTDHRKNPFIADKPDHEKTQAELIEELC